MGLTFDTGATIAKVLHVAHRRRLQITVPTVVVAQWWRGQRGPIWRHVMDAVDLEPLDLELARIAGSALAATGTSDIVDAIVVTSAAQRVGGPRGWAAARRQRPDLHCVFARERFRDPRRPESC